MKIANKYSLTFSMCLVAMFVFVGCDSKQVVKRKDGKRTTRTISGPAVAARQRIAGPEGGSASREAANESAIDDSVAEGEPAMQPKEDLETPPRTNEMSAGEKTEGSDGSFDVEVAEGGALKLEAPASWNKVKPRSFVVEYEIAVPKSDGDAADGRLTIMGAGGSVDANIQRWYGQYVQPDGGKTEDVAKVTNSDIAGSKVTWVDIKGTLLDKPGGPMAGGKTVERENYRTLAAIIQTDEHGQYFVKLYGPAKTITDNEAAFKGFIESLSINDDAKDQ